MRRTWSEVKISKICEKRLTKRKKLIQIKSKSEVRWCLCSSRWTWLSSSSAFVLSLKSFASERSVLSNSKIMATAWEKNSWQSFNCSSMASRALEWKTKLDYGMSPRKFKKTARRPLYKNWAKANYELVPMSKSMQVRKARAPFVLE